MLIGAQQCQRIFFAGGPIYRIGLGGGAASSVVVQGGGGRAATLDYGAVQRGDPEMEQKLHRLVRACAELGAQNPILSIHDQGAGGNGERASEIRAIIHLFPQATCSKKSSRAPTVAPFSTPIVSRSAIRQFRCASFGAPSKLAAVARA